MITLEEIYQGLAGEFQNQTGRTAGGSSELAVRFYAVAAQLYSLYVQGEWVRRQCFPQTAQGEALDQHAQLRGVTRRQAAKAAGTVRFYVDQPRQGDTPVAAGTVCMTAAGVRFVTEADGTVPAGALFCDAPVTAVQAGGEGNAEANTVVYMALPPWASRPAPTRRRCGAGRTPRATRPCGSGCWTPTAGWPTGPTTLFTLRRPCPSPRWRR